MSSEQTSVHDLSPWDISFPPSDLLTDNVDEKDVAESVHSVACPSCATIPSPDCPTCLGSGHVLKRMRVRRQYVTHSSSSVVNRSDLPDQQLNQCKGFLVYSVKGAHIIASDVFLDPGLNERVHDMVHAAKVEAAKSGSCIEYQQLFISVIPVRTFECVSGKKAIHVVVYDHDKKVLCDDFPCYASPLIGRVCNGLAI